MAVPYMKDTGHSDMCIGRLCIEHEDSRNHLQECDRGCDCVGFVCHGVGVPRLLWSQVQKSSHSLLLRPHPHSVDHHSDRPGLCSLS